MGVAYVVRITVLRKVGIEATGLYQSAWTLGGLYVAFILQAMGADFYPRLTACIAESADREPTGKRAGRDWAAPGRPGGSGDTYLRTSRDRAFL